MTYKKKLVMLRAMDRAERTMLLTMKKNGDVTVTPDNVRLSDVDEMLGMARLAINSELVVAKARKLIEVKK